MAKGNGSTGEMSAQKALERILAAWDAQQAAERDLKTAQSEYLGAGRDGVERLGDLISDNRGAVNDGRAGEVLSQIIEAWDDRLASIAAALEKKQEAKSVADERRKAFEAAIGSTKQGELAV